MTHLSELCSWCGHLLDHPLPCPRTIQIAKSKTIPCPCRRTPKDQPDD